MIQNVQPPSGGGPPPNIPFFGATYGGVSWNAFTNANNFSSGCYSAENNNRESCNHTMRRTMGDEFVNYFFNQSQLRFAENDHISRLNGRYDDPSNTSGALWLPPDDSIPGRFGHFVPVFGHVKYGDSVRPDPQTPQPISAEQLRSIRSDVEKAITAKKCADFLKRLLDEAAIQTGEPYRDIMVTFDNIQFFYGGAQGFGGLATGSFEDGTAKANLRQFVEKFISADRSSYIRTQTAQNALAETLHHVGTHEAYDDAAMASALNAIYVRQGIDVPKAFSNRTLKEVTRASNYWHSPVMNICSMKY